MWFATNKQGGKSVSAPFPDEPVSNGSFRTLLFVVILSLVSALILSILASALAKPKEIAKELDRSRQMMIAAKLLSHEGYFLTQDSVPARWDGQKLIPDPSKPIATQAQILEVYSKRLIPLLVNDKGEIETFSKLNINELEYMQKYRKSGYYKQPWKLVYEIKPNSGYVIPVNGYGLWDAIYGYLAIKPDGDTVIGITWYDQKETPGLGANISETYWQNLFDGKKIFQESPNGTTDFKTAPLGITVVKGKVAEVLGHSPKAKSAVDGMTGATLTGTGVSDAYKDVLAPYRPFLIKLHEEHGRK